MSTEERELSITLGELRKASATIVDALSASAAVGALDSDLLPLIHAYLLGCIIRHAGITPASIGKVLEFMTLGYKDFGHQTSGGNAPAP